MRGKIPLLFALLESPGGAVLGGGSSRARHLQCHGGSCEDPGPTRPSLALHHLLLHTSLLHGGFT